MARCLLRLVLVSGVLALGLTSTALSASNTVPGTTVTRFVTTITADKLKPAACSGIVLTTVVAGAIGTSGADLLLGSAAADVMSAGGGNDCVLGGGGNDVIDCGTGTDVVIGGPGTDTFGLNCETQIQ